MSVEYKLVEHAMSYYNNDKEKVALVLGISLNKVEELLMEGYNKERMPNVSTVSCYM
jgi:hypothetical protein